MLKLRGLVAIVSILAVVILAATAMPAARAADAPRQAVVTVKGLACPFCVYGLEKHLKKLPGVTGVRVDLGKGEATIKLEADAKVTEEQLRKAVRNAGFTAGRIEWKEPRGPD